MLTSTRPDINDILAHVAESLDISPTDYERAVRSYNAVGSWLEKGYENGSYPESTSIPEIYPQGSINLGTIVRPIREGKETDFDVDLVCELVVARTDLNPALIKKEVGDRLKANDIYREKLDPEGKRCWTLTYAESEGIGFHMDILPCVPFPEENHPTYLGAVSITNKNNSDNSYAWKPGNPKGYGEWFRDRNISFRKFAGSQKQRIFESHRSSQMGMIRYASIDDIPDQLVRTPLQRAIQLMKRHRDIRFAGNQKYKPISIIVTTLAAHLYQGETDVYTELTNIVNQLAMHSGLVADRYFTVNEKVAPLKLITRDENGEWHIANPVNERENFADRWHEDGNAKAHAFFKWIELLKEDLDILMGTETDRDLSNQLERIFGKRVASDVLKAAKPTTDTKTSLINRIGKAAGSLFNVSHRQPPRWEMKLSGSVRVRGIYTRDGFRPQQFSSDSAALPKHYSLRFEAETDIPCPYKAYWQVVNTGSEAEATPGGLRGGFYDGLTEKGGLARKESTLYKGKHWIECFIVKGGVCVARSGEFVVNIK